MSDYQYALFFEARNLTDRELERVKRYFQKKRDSGGGDCGTIEKCGGNIYKVCFSENTVQERVLQRKFHNLSLPSGELSLTVSRTHPRTADPTPPKTGQSKFEPLTKSNTKCLEKIYKLEIFILYYLRDNAKARKLLEKQLSCINCTVEFNLEEEEAVVSGSIDKRPGAADKWESQVDQVVVTFNESYLVYHVVDQKQQQILLQDRSFVTDEIKVYSDAGYAVVVGEVEALNKRIAILQKSVPTRKEIPIAEKRFNIIEEEFYQNMRAHYPEVKIQRGHTVIVLEGQDTDVQPGAAKLDELLQKVKEKRVPLSPAVLTFMAFSGAVPKYQARFQQSLRNPVSLEVGSVLLLSSLSSNALDEAEAAVLRDLHLETVNLQGAAAVSPDLDRIQEILLKAKDQVNVRELKVDVSFTPGLSETPSTNIQLVGYSDSVNKIKAVLLDYQVNQVGTQELVTLPQPELVDCFDRILYMIGKNWPNVTLKSSHFPYPCVLVSGPRRLVQEAQQTLTSALNSLIKDKLTLDGPGAQRYFQAEGKVSKELIETSCRVVIREQEVATPPNVRGETESHSTNSNNPSTSTSTSSRTSDHSTIPSKPCISSSASNHRNSPSHRSNTRSNPSVISNFSKPITSPGPYNVSSITSSSRGPPVAPKPRLPKFRLPTLPLLKKAPNMGGGNKTNIKIRICSLVDEQVNVLVVPMIKKRLDSTKIGQDIIAKTSNAIVVKFDSVAQKSTVAPGNVLQVDAPPSLGCSKLFFIECLQWDGVKGKGVQALTKGLKKCLDLCVQQNYSSVSIPIIGPGPVLQFPPTEAIRALTDTIQQFGSSASPGSLSTIHIVIKDGYPDTLQKYQEVHRNLSMTPNQAGQAMPSPPAGGLDDVTLTVGGGVTLELVFGDITKETTDAVVNTTDFVNFDSDGVCKAILAVAGPEVEKELRAAKDNQEPVFVTLSGWLPCKAIIHVCGKRDASVIEQLVSRIVQVCETYPFTSVAIPAINAGSAGLDPGVVAGAILRGINTATSTNKLNFLTTVRLVLNKVEVFLAFKEEAKQLFSPSLFPRAAPLPQVPQSPPLSPSPDVQQQPPPQAKSADLSVLHARSMNQQSVFLFLGLRREDVDEAMKKLETLYQNQCSSQTFKKEELRGLGRDDLDKLRQVMETQGLSMQEDQGGLTVRGLKDGVNQVTQRVNSSLQVFLTNEMRAREEQELYIRVAWCILGHNGWERFPKEASFQLENENVAGGVVDAQNNKWTVDLQKMEATKRGKKTDIKRLENIEDFSLPLYWDNMTAGETLLLVTLQPSSIEYQTVYEGFKRTAQNNVLKIQRVQSIHLRRSYDAQKKRISEKNGQDTGGEMLLFHGTSQDSCKSIMNTGFDRRYAGQNATSYGHGTYFAVNASYSAHPTYSKPTADGSQMMFVARVLTGVFSLGQSNMKVAPPRSDQPNSFFDSVVDRINSPCMYVVFHDNQAYPDYLITFQ